MKPEREYVMALINNYKFANKSSFFRHLRRIRAGRSNKDQKVKIVKTRNQTKMAVIQ